MSRSNPLSSRMRRKLQISRYCTLPNASVQIVTNIYFLITSTILVGLVAFVNSNTPIGGVPIPIIIEFLKDESARNALFSGNSTRLHDRLKEMGIKEEIKAYYRPQIHDEAKLDQHIHQIFYERTGYVGKSYLVNSQGILVPKWPSTQLPLITTELKHLLLLPKKSHTKDTPDPGMHKVKSDRSWDTVNRGA